MYVYIVWRQKHTTYVHVEKNSNSLTRKINVIDDIFREEMNLFKKFARLGLSCLKK